MEQIDLTTPEQYPLPTKTVVSWRVDEIHLQWSAQHIGIVVLGPDNERREIHYNGAIATSLMTTLNKVNMSVKSLHKRVLEYIVADGKMAGTITGVVD